MSQKKAVSLCLFICLLLISAANLQETEAPLILISEVAYDTWRDDALNEWIELLVISEEPVEAEQIKLGDEEEIGGGEGMVRFPKGTILQPNQVIVIAQSAADFRNVYGFYPTFEIIDSTDEIPNMRPVSLLAKGDIALANSGDEVILLTDRNRPMDRISYGDKTTFLKPPIQTVEAGWSFERFPPNCDTNSAADFRAQSAPTPLELPEYGICPIKVAEPTTLPPTPTQLSKTGDFIGSIQGNSSTSPKVDQKVNFSGIVTAITADKNASGTTFYTFFVQDGGDDDPNSSDAMPVFNNRRFPQIEIGDLVEINGTVTEYFGLTEIEAKELSLKTVNGKNKLPEPIRLDSINKPRESLEGMLVTLPEAIVVGPMTESPSGCGFAVVPVGTELPIIRHSISEDVSAIIPILPNDDRDCDQLPAVKRGDRVFGLMGPLTWNFGEWKIIQQPDQPIRVELSNNLPIPQKILLNGNQFSLATLNLENHFDSVDDTGDDSEPKPSAAIIAVREQKFAHLISDALGCPTIIGIQEVEKEALLNSLAATIEPLCGFKYGVAHRESYDGRGIDNALMFNPKRIKIVEYQLRQTCTRISTGIEPNGFVCPAGQEPLFSRPPFEAELLVDGQPLIVLVNHFKSKRGGEQETAPRRLAQAEFINDWLENRLEERPIPIAVIGDFNDYADSPALSAMTESGLLENALRQLPKEDQYSFNFGGAAQLIDGILLTADLENNLRSVEILHLNADYPDSLQLDIAPENLPFKATDHDPAIVIFDQMPLLQQVDEASAGNRSETENSAGNIATIQADSETKNSWGWSIWLIPVGVLLIATLFVVFTGKSSKD